jgi:hypothetical protein
MFRTEPVTLFPLLSLPVVARARERHQGFEPVHTFDDPDDPATLSQRFPSRFPTGPFFHATVRLYRIELTTRHTTALPEVARRSLTHDLEGRNALPQRF